MLSELQLKPMKELLLDKIPDYCIWDGSVVRTKMLSMIWSLASDREVNILDVGCGAARMWRPILEQLPNVSLYGFDPSSQSVQIANKELDGLKASIKQGDVRKLADFFPEVDQFDFIVSHSVLEHVVPRDIYFASVARRLKNDGVAVISWGADHFRQGLRTDIRNFISRVLAEIGIEQYYAVEVDKKWAVEKINEAGLKINALQHYSIVELKKMYRLATGDSRKIILQNWIKVEEEFNRCAGDNPVFAKRMDETLSILTRE